MVTLSQTIPALPVRDAAAATAFYRDRLGFSVVHADDGFAVLRRDAAEVHLWQSGDDSWRQRDSVERPVRSGAESFLAGTASCRIRVDRPESVDELHAELERQQALHRASIGGAAETDFGTREVHAVDVDGNLITFFCWLGPTVT